MTDELEAARKAASFDRTEIDLFHARQSKLESEMKALAVRQEVTARRIDAIASYIGLPAGLLDGDNPGLGQRPVGPDNPAHA